jgi:glycosyltransferase involved in cell wall biosynthesis
LSRLINPLAILPDTPKVSVCIPVYNAGEYLRSAISSVLTQCFTDFELIIVDDCSTESTETIVAEFDDARLSFHRNSQNLGLVGNWNRCLELTRGEYITIFHQDDVMFPNNLNRQVAMLNETSTIGFVYPNIRRIDAAGQVIGGHWLPGLTQPEADTILPGEAIFEAVAAYGNIIPCPAVVVRRECYERLGTFDARIPFATDLEMWMRIAANYDAGYLADPLVAHRVHPEQETAKFANTGRDYLDILHALNIVFSRKLPQTHLRHARRAYQTLRSQAISMARWKFRQGRVISALRYMSVASKASLRAYKLRGRS